MDLTKLKEIIEKHLHWIEKDCDGWQDMRADLSGANLSRADLSGANLSRAYLSGANLSGADLYGANLSRADLSGANLSRAYLSGANLSRADLSGANLSGANLYGAYLSRANLYGANLYGADLYGANLSRANLYGADLSRANLSGANLYGAKIEDKLINRFYPICCPEYGAFTGWKKANGYIVKLQITEDAKRSSAFGRKCRCSKAIVLNIENPDGTDSELKEIASGYDVDFIYRIGETVEVADFDEDRKNECAPGIHFFITRDEAVNY